MIKKSKDLLKNDFENELKVTSDLGKAMVFVGYSVFFHHLQLASHDLAILLQKDKLY